MADVVREHGSEDAGHYDRADASELGFYFLFFLNSEQLPSNWDRLKEIWELCWDWQEEVLNLSVLSFWATEVLWWWMLGMDNYADIIKKPWDGKDRKWHS